MNKTYLERYSKNGMILNELQRKTFNEFNEAVYSGEIIIDEVKSCFCGSKDFELLSRFDRFGLPFGTQICKKCGLITQNRRINEKSMELFYDKYYWNLIAGKAIEIGFSTPPKIDDTTIFITDLVDSKSKILNIFEVGVGSGDRISSLSDAFSKKGIEVNAYGCDYSEKALKAASNKNINTIKGGFDQISKFGKADILILSHLYEHLPDLKKSLKQIDKLAHEDTLIYIELPGILDLQNKKEYMYNYQDYNVLAHTYNFSLDTLSYTLSTQGYGLVKGNEFIRAVYKKSTNIKIDNSKNYERIINSLKLAFKRDLEFDNKLNNPLRKYFVRVIKAILNQ